MVMAKNTTARTDQDHRDALKRMVERGEADSPSEALRQTSQRDLARRGYLNGHGSNMVAGAFNRVGEVLGILGLALLAATMFYPVSWRWPALVVFVVAAVSFGLERAVIRWEPATVERIFGNGEKA